MLLVVSNKKDLATDYLVLKLHEKEIDFIRLNTEDYLSSWNANISIGVDSNDATISVNDIKPFSIHSITGAYIRQPELPKLDVAESDKSFAEREVGESLKSLWRLIDDEIWLNAPHRILRSSNKPEQLVLAKQFGLIIPKTCVCSDANTAKLFYEECNEDMVAKAVKHGFVYENDLARVATTQKIDTEFFDRFEEFAPIPMIFQENIHKEYDIRATIVGDKIFSTAILSQSNEITRTDWRLSDCHKISLEQHKIELPEQIENSCIRMTKNFGLRYSAIDLVLGKDGSYYFLELNPNGQWAWLEQLGIHNIREAIIEELCSDLRAEK